MPSPTKKTKPAPPDPTAVRSAVQPMATVTEAESAAPLAAGEFVAPLASAVATQPLNHAQRVRLRSKLKQKYHG